MNEPRTADEYNNQGIGLVNKGEYDKGVEYFRKAISINSERSEYWNNLGSVLNQRGEYQEAIKSFQKALSLNPNFAGTYIGLGNIFQRQGKLKKAFDYYQRALEISPKFPSVYNNLGAILLDQGKSDEAISTFKKGLEVNPQHPLIHYNLGRAFQNQEKIKEAILNYQKAIKLGPTYIEIYNSLALILERLGNFNEAIDYYLQALKINPQHTRIMANLTHLLQQTCDWQRLKEVSNRLDQLIEAEIEKDERTGEAPFISLSRCDDLRHNLKVAQSWSRHLKKRITGLHSSFSFKDRPLSKKKLNIGYLSYDFRDHAMGHQIFELFKLHDRKKFKIIAYSFGPDDDSFYRKRAEEDTDKFVNIKEKSHLEVAEIIYKDKIDILVDLMGYTEGHRLEICALRPAPIQVAYLGFPGTMGSDFLDYLITDKIITPKKHSPFYTEKFCYLPDCYQINSQQKISKKKFKRADFGLPEKSFVLCSFNHSFKIDPTIFDSWMKILKAVPKSVLWLLKSGPITEGNLKQEAEKRGVSPKRLIFADRLPLEEHLSRLSLADLALDTRIYNGGATTCNALYVGLPVVVMMGNHYVSRMGASFLATIDLPELITSSPKAYEKLVIDLATNPEKLKGIKDKLIKNKSTTPLFNTPLFVKNLEKAYLEMWRNYQNGQKPKRIIV